MGESKNAARARRAEAKAVEAGGYRLPGVILSTKATQALRELERNGYGHGVKAVIERALVEARNDERLF